VRWRYNPTQHRCGQPGAGGRYERYLHVHHNADQCDPHSGLCAAGPGLRIGPGGRGGHSRARNPWSGLPGQGYGARRGSRAGRADERWRGTRRLLTETDVPNADEALFPGVYCTVALHIPRKVPSLIIPAEAIVFGADGLHVAVLEDGTAHFRKVTVTRDFGTT